MAHSGIEQFTKEQIALAYEEDLRDMRLGHIVVGMIWAGVTFIAVLVALGL